VYVLPANSGLSKWSNDVVVLFMQHAAYGGGNDTIGLCSCSKLRLLPPAGQITVVPSQERIYEYL